MLGRRDQSRVGGNGGLSCDTRLDKDQICVLDAAGRQQIVETYRRIGIEPMLRPAEEFIVGRTAYARGMRLEHLSRTPLYA